jgi:hypothetical protein
MIYASKISNGHLKQAITISFSYVSNGLYNFLGPSALAMQAMSKNARLLCGNQTEIARAKSQHGPHIIRDGKGRISLGFHFFHCYSLCKLD